MNIAQERDFYAVRDLTKHDIEYISRIAEGRHKGVLASHNSKFLALYKAVSAMRGMAGQDEKVRELLIEFEESFMSVVERQAIGFLRLLRLGKVGFFCIDECRAQFSFFAMIQFLRTKKMSERVKALMGEKLALQSINVDNVWPVEKYIDAGHMALSLFSDKTFKIHFLNNATALPFITGDQPIFNIHSIGIGDSIPDKVAFYYPISPESAILISQDEYWAPVSDEMVCKFNSFIKIMSHEQVYAHEEKFL
jgi:Protein of unknown function (DUF4238)